MIKPRRKKLKRRKTLGEVVTAKLLASARQRAKKEETPL